MKKIIDDCEAEMGQMKNGDFYWKFSLGKADYGNVISEDEFVSYEKFEEEIKDAIKKLKS